MDDVHPLASERLVVATDLEDGREARIRVAIPINEETLRERFGDRIGWRNSVEWSSRHRRVEARRREMFGAIALRDEIWHDCPAERLGQSLADGIRELGLDTLNWSRAALRFRTRVAWANRMSVSAEFPDLSDQALLDDLDKWLTPRLSGKRAISDTRDLDLLQLIRDRLDWSQREQLEKVAPETFATPAGTKRPVDYSGEAPRVAVRIQEMYGTSVHPTLGGRRQPILFDLLSPADRPVQTTADLPAFWSSSYADVRKDLRMRYPKHDWPENPRDSTPKVRSVRPRASKHTKN